MPPEHVEERHRCRRHLLQQREVVVRSHIDNDRRSTDVRSFNFGKTS